MSENQPVRPWLLGKPLAFCVRRAVESLEGVAYEVLAEGHLTRDRRLIVLGRALFVRATAIGTAVGGATPGGACIRRIAPG